MEKESSNSLSRTIILLARFEQNYVFGQRYILSQSSNTASNFEKVTKFLELKNVAQNECVLRYLSSVRLKMNLCSIAHGFPSLCYRMSANFLVHKTTNLCATQNRTEGNILRCTKRTQNKTKIVKWRLLYKGYFLFLQTFFKLQRVP